MFVAADDEEVSASLCKALASNLTRRGERNLEMVWYVGATHAFDDPGKQRQAIEANRIARADAMVRSAEFFARELKP